MDKQPRAECESPLDGTRTPAANTYTGDDHSILNWRKVSVLTNATSRYHTTCMLGLAATSPFILHAMKASDAVALAVSDEKERLFAR